MSRQASGLKAWAIQRATAIYIGLYLVVVLYRLLFAPPSGYQELHDWLAGPLGGITALLFFLALLLHAWVGMRDILIDYVKPISLRAGLLGLLATALLACGIWVSQVIILVRLT